MSDTSGEHASGPTGSVVLIGPPGAGCTTVGRALAGVRGVPVVDLGEEVARAAGTSPDVALVAVPEVRYRRIEAAIALDLLAGAARTANRPMVIALGSGCLEDPEVRRSLDEVVDAGGRVVALTASTRCLATRDGLDAPRSIALRGVRRAFVQMLHARRPLCGGLAAAQIDTTQTTPREAAALIADDW